MPPRINITVTEADIDRAHRSDSYKCVVSQAIARAIPDATRIDTDTQLIRFTSGGIRYGYLTPYVVQGYVIAFDAGDPVRPFSFQLRNGMELKRRAHDGPVFTTCDICGKEDVKTAGMGPHKRKAHGVQGTGEKRPAAKMDKSAKSGARMAPRRVFRTKQRSYGHRVLRINQKEAEAAE